jgi:glycosyltransferase involved in cell wall biosynthesis
MNVLFMTIAYPKTGESNIYTDLMQEFVRNNHKVYIACTNERRNGQQTAVNEEDGKYVLRIRTGNLIGNVNLIEKSLTMISLEGTFIKSIRTRFYGIKFDLIIYSTPPITFAKAVEYFKNRDNAKTYLLLKDIFPQNAVDIGVMKNKGLVYKFFRSKEKKLYAVSDYIGCMSQANVDYVLKHNPNIVPKTVEICPNSVLPSEKYKANKQVIKKIYNIPSKSTIFIYGGNLGKPQGIDFVIECLKSNMNLDDRFFIISGTGTEYYKLETFYKEKYPNNILIINGLPKNEYELLVSSCDVGLIFLDHRFTIPNFPSRLLSYMDYAMPVVACTDVNTDIGKIICDGKFGWWCESNDIKGFKNIIDSICLTRDRLSVFGSSSRKYLEENFTVKNSYEIIMKHFNNLIGGRVECLKEKPY